VANVHVTVVRNGVETLELDVPEGSTVRQVAGNGVIITEGNAAVPPDAPVRAGMTINATTAPKEFGR